MPLRKDSLENDRNHTAITGPRRQPEFGQLARVHHGFGRAEKNLDHDFGRDVFADDSLPTAFVEQPAEVALDQVAPPRFHQFKHFRRGAPYIAHERGLNFFSMMLHASEQSMQAVES